MGISWKMIAVGVFGLFLLFGCLGSGASDNHTTVANTQTLTQPSAADQTQTLTQPSAEEQKQKAVEEQKQKAVEEQKQKEAEEQKQKEAEEQAAQDLAWLGYVKSYCGIIGPDFTNIGQAANSGDLESLYLYALQARSDINAALEQDSDYHPSSKYQSAHSEWLSALRDQKASMDLIISAENEGWTDIQKIRDATSKMNSGKAHLTSCTNDIQNA